MPPLGERFRAARETRGLSLSDVSEQIRIRSVYLAAIEEESWIAIGAPVYVRGFLRTYARFLGLDPEEVVASFNSGSPAASQVPAIAERQPRSSSGPIVSGIADDEQKRRAAAPLIWAASVVAALLVAFVVYNEFTMHREPETSSVAASTASAALPSNSPGPSPSPSETLLPGPGYGPNSIALVLSAPSWLRVTVDGNVSMEGTFPAGTEKTFHGKNALVRIGNAGGVEIFVDGKDVGKLGKSGDVVEHAFTL
ncbi:MAG TPA: RodZ domain-containing protein [Candidatus Baltobacteraceae bacterium]|jgi:cytoskeletal protein RodZ|nr:RodZ domain-containing protein [Candidatus Baltobacteraceae bacterium]